MAKTDRTRRQLPGRVLTLAPDAAPQKDMIEQMEFILAHMRAGTITGIAFACVLKQNRFITDVLGSCATQMTFTRGIIMTLNDELGAAIYNADPDEIR